MSKTDNHATIEKINRTQQKIVQSAAKDYLVFYGWGLYSVLLIPGFDFVNQAIWGPIVWLAALSGMVLTWRYYAAGHSRVKLFNQIGWRTWFGYIVWAWACSTLTILTTGHVKYPYTLGGVVLGLPIIAYGVYLKWRSD